MGDIGEGARILLDLIGDTEAPKGYGTIYGNNQNRLGRPLTAMTLDQVIASGRSWSKRYGSSAAGRYQFMNATLIGLKQELGLAGGLLFDAELQDRLGMRLLERRGYELFVAGAIDRIEFGKRLAQEWASFPVLAACRGQKRMLARGQSYYAGDGRNRALVTPQKVEAILDKVLETVQPPEARPAPGATEKAAEPPPARPSGLFSSLLKTLTKGAFS
jgi:muramidase (phage lysozyme)